MKDRPAAAPPDYPSDHLLTVSQAQNAGRFESNATVLFVSGRQRGGPLCEKIPPAGTTNSYRERTLSSSV